MKWRESRRVGQNEVKEMRGWRSCWPVLPKYGFCTLVSRITSISFIWFDRHENVPLRSPNTGSIIEQQSSYCIETYLASHSSKAAFHRLPQPSLRTARILRQVWEALEDSDSLSELSLQSHCNQYLLLSPLSLLHSGSDCI